VTFSCKLVVNYFQFRVASLKSYLTLSLIFISLTSLKVVFFVLWSFELAHLNCLSGIAYFFIGLFILFLLVCRRTWLQIFQFCVSSALNLSPAPKQLICSLTSFSFFYHMIVFKFYIVRYMYVFFKNFCV
jgi:hypothetical protein